MDPIQLILIAIRGLSPFLSSIVGNKYVHRINETQQLLGILAEILERGDEGYDDLKAFAEQVQMMVDEKRNPTTAEWASLRSRSDAATAAIQTALDASSESETDDTEIPVDIPSETSETAVKDAEDASEGGTADPVAVVVENQAQ